MFSQSDRWNSIVSIQLQVVRCYLAVVVTVAVTVLVVAEVGIPIVRIITSGRLEIWFLIFFEVPHARTRARSLKNMRRLTHQTCERTPPTILHS